MEDGKMAGRNIEKGHVQELLSAYIDRQMTEAEARRVEAHLAECAPCRAELESLRQTIAVIKAAPRLVPPRSFTLSEADVQAFLPAARRRSYWLAGLTALAGAAVTLLLVFGVIFWRIGRLPFGAAPAQQAAMAPTREEQKAAAEVPQPAAPTAEAPVFAAASPTQAAEHLTQPSTTGQALGAAPPVAPEADHANKAQESAATLPPAATEAAGAMELSRAKEAAPAPQAAPAEGAVQEDKGSLAAPAATWVITDVQAKAEESRLSITATVPLSTGTALLVDLQREDGNSLAWELLEPHSLTVGLQGRLSMVLIPGSGATVTDLRSNPDFYRLILKEEKNPLVEIGALIFEIHGQSE